MKFKKLFEKLYKNPYFVIVFAVLIPILFIDSVGFKYGLGVALIFLVGIPCLIFLPKAWAQKGFIESMIFSKPLKDFDKGEKPIWFFNTRRQRYEERLKK